MYAHLRIIYVNNSSINPTCTYVNYISRHKKLYSFSENNKPYRHPELSENDRRLATFQNPYIQSVLTPKRLADAGLYYTGIFF